MRVVELPRSNWVPSSIAARERSKRSRGRSTSLANRGCSSPRPETVVPYYPYFSFIQPAYQIVGGHEHLKLLDEAVTVPSSATHAISEACKRARVVASIGVNERDGETVDNTQL